MRVLFLGAHPDDELGCAGTIFKLNNYGFNPKVTAVTFTTCADELPSGFSESDIVVEWQMAMNRIGVEDMSIHHFPNKNLPEFRQPILEILDNYRNPLPDLVLIPSPTDSHQDHRTVAEEGIRAFKQTSILSYELPLNAVRSGVPNAFQPLNEYEMIAKKDHAAMYKSQARKNYMAGDYIEALATVRGMQIGRDYAEGFEVIRWVL